MQVVIYSTDYLPITVIDLPIDVYTKACKDKGVRLKLKNSGEYCELQAIPVAFGSGEFRELFITDDETQALKLSPAWLPGQLASINAAKSIIRKLKSRESPDDNYN